MAESIKNELTIPFTTSGGDDDSDPGPDCNAWVRPWVDRNKNTGNGTGGLVGPSKSRLDLAFNELAHKYVWDILEPGGIGGGGGGGDPTPEEAKLRVILSALGVPNSSGWHSTRRADELLQSLTISLTPPDPTDPADPNNPGGGVTVIVGGGAGGVGSDECPLVPYGVFVNYIHTNLVPQPLPEDRRTSGSGDIGAGAGEVTPWWRMTMDENGGLSLELDLWILKVSTDLTHDRLPAHRIDDPRITGDLTAVNTGTLRGHSLRKDANGVHEVWAGNRALLDYAGDSGTVGITLYSPGPGAKVPDAFTENVWYGDFLGTPYSAEVMDGGETILTVSTTQGGAAGLPPPPVWELYEQDQVPDIEVYYSLGPSYGVRVQWAEPIYHWLLADRPESLVEAEWLWQGGLLSLNTETLDTDVDILHWTQNPRVAVGDLRSKPPTPSVTLTLQTNAGVVYEQAMLTITRLRGEGDLHRARVELEVPFSKLQSTYPQAKFEVVWDGTFPTTPGVTSYEAVLTDSNGKTIVNAFPDQSDHRVEGLQWEEWKNSTLYADVRYAVAKAPYWGLRAEAVCPPNTLALTVDKSTYDSIPPMSLLVDLPELGMLLGGFFFPVQLATNLDSVRANPSGPFFLSCTAEVETLHLSYHPESRMWNQTSRRTVTYINSEGTSASASKTTIQEPLSVGPGSWVNQRTVEYSPSEERYNFLNGQTGTNWVYKFSGVDVHCMLDVVANLIWMSFGGVKISYPIPMHFPGVQLLGDVILVNTPSTHYLVRGGVVTSFDASIFGGEAPRMVLLLHSP